MTLPEMLITGMALVGAMAARHSLASLVQRSGIALQLRASYTLIAMLLALRLLVDVFAAPWLVVPLLVVAAWLPFCGLRLVEELLRRHAPRGMKLCGLGGGVAFTVIALVMGPFWSEEALLALAAFQACMVLGLFMLLSGRDRRRLSPFERRTADVFRLALLLVVPLALSDFEVLLPVAPVRGGSFAFLIIVLATSGLIRVEGSPGRLLGDLAVMVGAAGLAIASQAAIGLPTTTGTSLQMAAVGAATAALVILVERSRRERIGRAGIVAALSRLPADASEAELVSSHPMLSSGVLLAGEALKNIPSADVDRLVTQRVVGGAAGDASLAEVARELLQSTASTHLIRLSKTPPRLLAISAGGLTDAALDDELNVASRLIESASK